MDPESERVKQMFHEHSIWRSVADSVYELLTLCRLCRSAARGGKNSRPSRHPASLNPIDHARVSYSPVAVARRSTRGTATRLTAAPAIEARLLRGRHALRRTPRQHE